MFSQTELNQWYDSNKPDLEWIQKPSRHQFRWKTIEGKWITNNRSISNSNTFNKIFKQKAPADLYIGTSSWLNPINLPRIKQTDLPAPILIEHHVVFDIDLRPFCYRRLEKARKITNSLLEWLDKNENLELIYISYSGSKGFHLVLKDKDRTLFRIEDPRERENKIRQNRKELLQRVLNAGFPVDKTVTADTRRIIRLPGSLHGTSGWICTRISRNKLATPLKKWIKELPRHPKAKKMQYWPIKIYESPLLFLGFILKLFRKNKPTKIKKIKKIYEGENETITSLQVSSHVIGTKDRSAIILWLPKHWKKKQKNIFENTLKENNWLPAHLWKSNERELIIVPRAIPKQQLIKIFSKIGLNKIASQINKLGHYWTDISPRNFSIQGMEEEMEYFGKLNINTNQNTLPWSLTHIEVLKRLGVIITLDNSETSGRPEPSLRIVTKE
tara:strand:+ start:467 stop:1795 length:1329 start_codon:yes stop_codon:yes gene_type:complete